jgi:hypothetical protein
MICGNIIDCYQLEAITRRHVEKEREEETLGLEASEKDSH